MTKDRFKLSFWDDKPEEKNTLMFDNYSEAHKKSIEVTHVFDNIEIYDTQTDKIVYRQYEDSEFRRNHYWSTEEKNT
jgi:hypothetical protein